MNQVRIAMGEDGRARGFCHIEFADPAHAEAAMKFNGQEIDGSKLSFYLNVFLSQYCASKYQVCISPK